MKLSGAKKDRKDAGQEGGRKLKRLKKGVAIKVKDQTVVIGESAEEAIRNWLLYGVWPTDLPQGKLFFEHPEYKGYIVTQYIRDVEAALKEEGYRPRKERRRKRG